MQIWDLLMQTLGYELCTKYLDPFVAHFCNEIKYKRFGDYCHPDFSPG